AEDGIRDKLVTGVQTCALPISGRDLPGALQERVALGPDQLLDLEDAVGVRHPDVGHRLLRRREVLARGQDRDGWEGSLRHLEAQIGRASCRERVWISALARALR